MATTYWVKLYIEVVDDPKMGRLSDNLWRRAAECFLIAGELGEGGFLPALEDMAWRLRRDQNTLHSELSQLAAVGIVELRKYDVFDNVRWFVSNFAERQAPSDAATRMREYRRRQREARQKEKESSKEKEKARKETDPDTDTDPYRDVTSYVTGGVTHVTKRNGVADGGPESDDEAVKLVVALMERWIEMTGGGLPVDMEKQVEDYFRPANSLLRRVGWDIERAFALLVDARGKMLETGKTPYRLAAVAPLALASLDGLARPVANDVDLTEQILRYANG